jgi:hypothetical protein
MGLTRVEGDVFVTGALGVAGGFTPPAGSIGNTQIAGLAGIDQSKLQHQHRGHYVQPNTTATTETKAVAVIYGVSGTLLSFKAGSIGVCAGGATITVDLKKNGTTVLSSVVTLNNANAARVSVAGTLSVVTLAAGDELEVVVVATVGGGTLGTGVFAEVRWKEDAQ